MILKLKNKDTLVFDQFEIKCAIGKKGLNNNKIEGEKTTPKGVFSFGKIYWRKEPIAKLIAGSNYLNPKIELIVDEMIENNERNNLNVYLHKWIIKKIETELNSLIELRDINEENPELRAMAY